MARDHLDIQVEQDSTVIDLGFHNLESARELRDTLAETVEELNDFIGFRERAEG